jgi:hypothetical protein
MQASNKGKLGKVMIRNGLTFLFSLLPVITEMTDL